MGARFRYAYTMGRSKFELAPAEYALQWRKARPSGSVGRILLPPGASAQLSGPGSAPGNIDHQKQDRIYLDYAHAWRMRRSCGFVGNMRFGDKGMNQRESAAAHVAVKVWWFGGECREYRHVFLAPPLIRAVSRRA